MTHTVTDDDTGRYELRSDDELLSWADYRLADGDSVVVVTHVETLPQHRDQGNSDRLMAGIVADLVARQRRIRPQCWVAAEYVRLHADPTLMAD